jgi:hypothetical protein
MSVTPEWLEDGTVVFAVTVTGHTDAAVRMDQAVEALTGAGVPCHVIPRERETGSGAIVQDYELIVPPKQHLRAISVLDREMLNAEMEADWRGHFDAMTDDELLELDEDALAGGLRDRADRLVRAWEDELLKRGLAELETGD